MFLNILKSFADNSEDKAQQIKEYPDLYQEYKNSNYSYEELAAQAEFYSHFAYQLEYQNDYPAYIKSILKNAQNLSSKKLFSNKRYCHKHANKNQNEVADLIIQNSTYRQIIN